MYMDSVSDEEVREGAELLDEAMDAGTSPQYSPTVSPWFRRKALSARL